MIVQIPTIPPLVLQMLAFEVFIIHLSSSSREGTCSVLLNYRILFCLLQWDRKQIIWATQKRGGRRERKIAGERERGNGKGREKERERKREGGSLWIPHSQCSHALDCAPLLSHSWRTKHVCCGWNAENTSYCYNYKEFDWMLIVWRVAIFIIF